MKPVTIFFLFIIGAFHGCKKNNDTIISSSLSISKKIIVFGSSIAAGIGATHDSLSWVGLFKKTRISDSILNFSIPGTTTFHTLPSKYKDSSFIVGAPSPVANNIDRVIQANPDFVVISITSNDIANGFTPDDYMKNISIITNQLKDQRIPYIITSTTIRGDINLIKRNQLFEIFKRVHEKYLTEFVDILTPLSDTTNFSIRTEFFNSDLIHPNNLGHEKIFNQIKQHLLIRRL